MGLLFVIDVRLFCVQNVMGSPVPCAHTHEVPAVSVYNVTKNCSHCVCVCQDCCR